MTWARPELWWLGLALPLGWWFLRRLQLGAFEEISRRVAPRFRGAYTRHSRGSLEAHLALLGLLAVLLLAAAAGPVLERTPQDGVRGAGRVLLMIDGSASMYATDIAGWQGESEVSRSRMAHAKALAGELVQLLPDTQFALGSFSGRPTLHLPMTRRRDLVRQALVSLENHSFYRNTGSSLTGALEEAFHFVAAESPGLQLVLLGDGELPFEEDYRAVVEALAEQGIAVHAVTFGTTAGQDRRILDFQEVLAKVESPRVLRAYTTRRVDEHYREIAAATGGSFRVAPAAAADLASALRAYRAPAGGTGTGIGTGAGGGVDLSSWLVALFLLGLTFEALVLGRPRRRPGFAFDLSRLGGPATGALLALSLGLGACSDAPIELAHRDNERGIEHDRLGMHRAARRAYERSTGYGEQSEIPTYNLGRSLTLAGSHSEAHEVFQRALELDPALVAAYFNDGIALYEWGRLERDPRDCDLERTRDLWRAAQERFALTLERADEEPALAESARANRAALAQRLRELERLIAEPPAHCRGGGGGGGGSGGAGGGGGGGGSGGGTGGGGGGGAGAGAAGGGGTAPPPPLSPQEQETVEQALERIRRQAYTEEKYHRRTLAEQFPRSVWAHPDAEIWW